MADITEINRQTKLYLYLNTGSDTRKNDLHLLFRGNANELFQSKNATYTDLDFLKEVYDNLYIELGKLGYRVGTHEELGIKSDEFLPNALHNHFKKDVLVFCISTKILWLPEDIDYYKTMLSIISAVKHLMTKYHS